jgi:multidrug efflux pump subunit AcrA (membrane-fusion protein)
VDPATRRVPVEAEIKNDQSGLLGGSFVRARVVGLDRLAVLKLPGETLRPGSQNEIMIVKGGRLEARKLTFTVASDGTLLVRDGLGAGERALLSPSAEAKDGDSVVLQ